jgi:hypothetical protein
MRKRQNHKPVANIQVHKKDEHSKKANLFTKDGLHEEVEWCNATGNPKGIIVGKSKCKLKSADSKKSRNRKEKVKHMKYCYRHRYNKI